MQSNGNYSDSELPGYLKLDFVLLKLKEIDSIL